MKPCKLTYAQIRRMWQSAEWAESFWWQLGIYDEAIRYRKIANRLFNSMMSYPAENIRRVA